MGLIDLGSYFGAQAGNHQKGGLVISLRGRRMQEWIKAKIKPNTERHYSQEGKGKKCFRGWSHYHSAASLVTADVIPLVFSAGIPATAGRDIWIVSMIEV